jgi:serine phosphatase RsbU (regulator of sigma subunit)
MDLAFCVLDKKSNIIQYAGAFNPLYIVRNNKLIEVKGQRFSIGANVDFDEFNGNPKVFNSHEIQLERNDMIYIFSDGYADQFGGPEGKKFKYRRFRHLLLTIQNCRWKSKNNIWMRVSKIGVGVLSRLMIFLLLA